MGSGLLRNIIRSYSSEFFLRNWQTYLILIMEMMGYRMLSNLCIIKQTFYSYRNCPRNPRVKLTWGLADDDSIVNVSIDLQSLSSLVAAFTEYCAEIKLWL
jgi:hypothetical protein